MAVGIEFLQSRFLKAFAGVPIGLRNEVVAIVNEEPINWSAAYVEIMGKTKKGDEILQRMNDLGLLEA